SGDPGVGADRDGRECPEGKWGCSERGSIQWQLIEAAQILGNQDSGPEQGRVDWAFIAVGSVDVHRIDSGDRGSALDESLGRLQAQVRVHVRSIPGGGPMPVPSGSEQDRM